MRCPKCGKNVYAHHQEINKTKDIVTRYYGCRNCHYKFRTVEKIVEESEEKNYDPDRITDYIGRTY